MSLVPVLALALLLGSCVPRKAQTREERLRRIDDMYDTYRAEFPEVGGISVDELVEALEAPDSLVLVDVRTDEEREVSIIPGAISRLEFESRPADFENRTIVTYCTIGYRSGIYADELRREGWEALNLEGSILAWTHAGRPLERLGEPTRRVHVYGSQWNLAAEDFEPVW